MRVFVSTMNSVNDWCFCRREGSGTRLWEWGWGLHFTESGRICAVIRKICPCSKMVVTGLYLLGCPCVEVANPAAGDFVFAPTASSTVSHWSQ